MNRDDVRIISMDITYDPLGNLYPKEVHKFGNTYQRRITKGKSQELIKELDDLMIKYPDCCVLTNWKFVVYQRSGFDKELIDALILRNYEQFPHYLYAKFAYAHLCFERDEWEKVPAIFGDTWVLPDIYPDRDVFHVSEVANFYHTMGKYHIYAKDIEAVRPCINFLEQLDTENSSRLALHLNMLLLAHCPEVLMDRMEKLFKGKRNMKPRRTKKMKELERLN